MRKLLFFFWLLGACAVLPFTVCAKDVVPISVKEAAELLGKPDVIILDVRTPAEFAGGHLPGARNMDFFGGRFEQQVSSLPKDKSVLLYCRSGKRSAGAAEALAEAGLKKIMDMHDGFQAWQKNGLPVEK